MSRWDPKTILSSPEKQSLVRDIEHAMTEKAELGRYSLKTYGTVSFTREVMSELIGWGTAVLDADGYYVLDPLQEPTNLSFAIWLTLVPKVYRDQVIAITTEVGERYLGQKATRQILDMVINEVLVKIFARVEPVSPCR